MKPARPRICLGALCICAMLALTACPGDPADNRTENGVPSSGLTLEGELVPSGGLSMSENYTLSGQLSPAMPKQNSASANFRLELTPAPAETGN